MSDFVQQNSSTSAFTSADSWVILSPIEQSIKQKIESAGVPLKDWDIQINYGIKTGFNDAFIISTEKREEILANCADEDERWRTDKLVRPILRGRDINRYGYEWAGLYIIATFPSRNYDIEKYPAVKKYLLSFAEETLREAGYDWVADDYLADFCKQKLSQTGEFVVIDGKRIRISSSDEKARKKTSNKWFETQDSISYWDDFSKPKIVWKRIGSILRFSYDINGCFGLDSTCFAQGNNLSYLTCVLNSKIGHYLLKDSPRTGTGDLIISVQAIEPLRIPLVSDDKKYIRLISLILKGDKNAESIAFESISDLYGFTQKERNYVLSR